MPLDGADICHCAFTLSHCWLEWPSWECWHWAQLETFKVWIGGHCLIAPIWRFVKGTWLSGQSYHFPGDVLFWVCDDLPTNCHAYAWPLRGNLIFCVELTDSWLINCINDWPPDWMTDSLTDSHTHWLTRILADWLAYSPTDSLSHWLIHSLSHQLIHDLIHWWETVFRLGSPPMAKS